MCHPDVGSLGLLCQHHRGTGQKCRLLGSVQPHSDPPCTHQVQDLRYRVLTKPHIPSREVGAASGAPDWATCLGISDPSVGGIAGHHHGRPSISQHCSTSQSLMDPYAPGRSEGPGSDERQGSLEPSVFQIMACHEVFLPLPCAVALRRVGHTRGGRCSPLGKTGAVTVRNMFLLRSYESSCIN